MNEQAPNPDNQLSKNIRPAILIFSWILLAFVIVTMLFKKEVNEIMLTTISYLVGLLTSGYFGLREFGKHQQKPKP